MIDIRQKLSNAVEGITYAWKTSVGFRLISAASLYVIALAMFFHMPEMVYIVFLFLMTIAYAIKLTQIAVERLCRLLEDEQALKFVQELMSGALLLIGIIFFVYSLTTFVPPVVAFFKS